MKHFTKYLLLLLNISCLPIVAQESFSLKEALDYGEEHHNDVLLQQKEISIADEDIREYRSIGMPKVNGAVNYQYYFYAPVQPTPDFLTPAVYNVLFDENVIEERELGPPDVFEIGFVQPHNFNVGLEASMLVFDGSYLVGLRAAKLYRELVRKQVGATIQDVRSKIASAYASALIAQENLKIIDKNILTIDKSLRETKIIFEEGFAESLDVDRLTLSSNNLHTEREKLVGLIELTLNLLKFQMNFPQDQAIILSDEITDLVSLDVLVYDNLNIDFGERAEYDVLQTSKSLNHLDEERNRKGYLPSVRVFSNLQGALLRRNLFDGDEAGFLPTGVVGMGITVPIYDGGEKSARIQKARINVEKTDIQIEQFKSAMQFQIKSAIINIDNARTTLANSENALAINERIFNKTQIKFNEGVGSSVELTQAENSLYQAQGSYINALYDLLNAQNELQIALGKI